MTIERKRQEDAININIRNMLNKDQLQTDALCFEKANFDLAELNVKDFTEDINLKGYLICNYVEGSQCKCGISFGKNIMCSSLFILSLRKK